MGDCGETVAGEAAAGADGTEDDEEEKRARGRAARARTCLLSIVVVNLDEFGSGALVDDVGLRLTLVRASERHPVV